MPELPEVETVRLGLIPVMKKKTILWLDQRRLDLRWPLPKNMEGRLKNVNIEDITRRSKYLMLKLSSKETLIIHLGMSGRLLILKEIEDTTTQLGNFNFNTHKTDKHDHIIFHLEGGIRVVYNDPRRFGAMDLVSTVGINRHKWFVNLGPEPLGDEFSSDYLYLKLQRKKSSIKSVLMDQKIVSGLGNIYVLESLWRSGISPIRRAHQVKRCEAEDLFLSIRSVLAEAIDSGGTSLQDFRQVGGGLGYFKQCLRVYGRSEKACRNSDCSGTIRKVKQVGRTSYYCDHCQT